MISREKLIAQLHEIYGSLLASVPVEISRCYTQTFEEIETILKKEVK